MSKLRKTVSIVPISVSKLPFLMSIDTFFVYIAKITGMPKGEAHNILEYRGRAGKDMRDLMIVGGFECFLDSDRKSKIDGTQVTRRKISSFKN